MRTATGDGMKKPALQVQGLDAARYILQFTQIVGSTNAGADYLGGPRDDGKSNSEVMRHLAEGGRPLYASESDGKEATKAFASELARQMRRLGDKNAPGDVERYARAGIVGGLRKGANILRGYLTTRIEHRAITSGASAKKVTEEYAIARERKWGVNKEAVFIASKQLINSVMRGTIKIHINMKGIARALKHIVRS